MNKIVNKDIQREARDKRTTRRVKERLEKEWEDYRNLCVEELVCPLCGKDMKEDISATRQYPYNYDCKCGYTCSYHSKGPHKDFFDSKEVY